jgi:hypothetical protein
MSGQIETLLALPGKHPPRVCPSCLQFGRAPAYSRVVAAAAVAVVMLLAGEFRPGPGRRTGRQSGRWLRLRRTCARACTAHAQ